MREEISVAFAVDRGYFNQAAVVIASILANTSRPDDLRFHIVHAEDEAWVAEQIVSWRAPHVRAVRAQNPFDEIGHNTHVSRAALLRTLLPVLLPHLDRVIYLDADVIVTGDIADLWGVDLGENAIGGVVDVGVYIRMTRAEQQTENELRDCQLLLGLNPDENEYVNSGVLLMDLAKLREVRFSELARDMDEEYRDRLMFVDQDIINALLADRMKLLDPRWNVSAQVWSRSGRRRHYYVLERLGREMALQARNHWLIHWTGPSKPWNDSRVAFGGMWWRYAEASGVQWRRPAPARRTLGTALRNCWLDSRAAISALSYRISRPAAKRK
ncbi:glycosyltransferase family 8 protein [Devosia sp. ZB163]|uniref:glycosyltransferase family 8 protein n=1 Tax=Devosia sp. ZB163 TaxID=3025938 RepID=UPI00235F2303|nr:glycosyltransferase family 8 protein [Devosia sp. ZB163]MDC9825771.1 glycosyltransferase family 8 protein [Devosia sp. ZB163]